MNLWELQPGAEVFVEMRLRLYPGTVILHSVYDRAVRIQTEAAKVIRVYWQSMSFRWSDGRALAQSYDGAVIVPQSEEELSQCLRRVEADREAQRRGLERAHMPAGEQAQFWWQDG